MTLRIPEPGHFNDLLRMKSEQLISQRPGLYRPTHVIAWRQRESQLGALYAPADRLAIPLLEAPTQRLVANF